MLIGAIGYIPKLKPISTAFLALVIVVLFLKKGTGFFAQLTTGLGSTTTVLSPNAATSLGTMNPNQPVGNNLSQYLQALPPLGGIQ